MGRKRTVTTSREYAESIINTVREPLIALDQDLRVVTANRSFYKVFKVTPEETVGQLIYDLGNKQWNIPRLRKLLETILPQKTSFDDYEVKHDFSAIGTRTMLLNARQIERVRGMERIILLAIEDITDRKRREDLLTESEERYRHIFETASDGIVLLEKNEGNIVHANLAVEKLLGYSEAEYIGKKLTDIGISLDMSNFPAIMHSLNKSGILNYDDVPVKTKSGQYIDTDIYMVDRARLTQCNIRDVSERKQAENKLKAEKSFIENALNTLQDIFFVFDLEGRFLRWNRSMSAVTGYADTEIALMKPTDFFRNDHKERVSAAIREGIKEGGARVDAIVFTKDERPIPYELSASLIRDHTGDKIGMSVVGRDLTEHNKLQAQLLHSQKMEAIGTLAGGIAHDFNNLLTTITGYTEMMLMEVDKDSPLRSGMEEIKLASDRAANLTRQLLAFSRKQMIQPVVLDLNYPLAEMDKMLRRLIGEDIDLITVLEPELWKVKFDPGQMDQVVMNLAVNAKDAMPEGGKLTIETANVDLDEAYARQHGIELESGPLVMVAVSDTGMGIDEETQSHIFEPFFTTKEKGKGTGLGLSTVYGIVKQSGGFIWVYSEPGQGTTFKIYLPAIASAQASRAGLPKAEAEEAFAEEEQIEPQHLEGSETILVAEDDDSARKLMRSVLQGYGYRVLEAQDGEEAVRLFEQHEGPIHLLLTDVVMPGMNGRELAERLQPLQPKMKVLYMSGYTDNAIVHSGILETEMPFIQKPFAPEVLASKVRMVLDACRRSRL
jgi:two-component system cell cycle sensor histidine kinase/response regulator CckA